MLTLLVVGIMALNNVGILFVVEDFKTKKVAHKCDCQSKVIYVDCPCPTCQDCDVFCPTCLDPKSSRREADTIPCPRYFWPIIHGSRSTPIIYFDDRAAACPEQSRQLEHCLVYSKCIEKMQETICRGERW